MSDTHGVEFMIQFNRGRVPGQHSPLHVPSTHANTIAGHSFPQRCTETKTTIRLANKQVLQVGTEAGAQIVHAKIERKAD